MELILILYKQQRETELGQIEYTYPKRLPKKQTLQAGTQGSRTYTGKERGKNIHSRGGSEG